MTDHKGRGGQLVRQWGLLMKLASHRHVGVTIGELVEEFGTGRRTIERDLAALTEAGFAIGVIQQEGTRKYWGVTGPAPDLPPFPLDQEGLIAVWMAGGLMDFFEGTPYQDGMKRVRDRISSTLSPKVVAKLEDIEKFFSPARHQHGTYAKKKEIISRLNDAILSQRVCKMVYRKPSDEKPGNYRIHPCGIVPYRQLLYLAALKPGDEELRIFAISRIRKLEVTGERFEVPEDFSLSDRIGKSFGIYQGEPVKVTVRFDKEVAHFPQEIRYHPTQKNKKNKDGSVDVTMTVGGLQEVVWWVLSYTDNVQVLHPPELAEEVRKTAEAIAERYVAKTK